MTLQFNGVTLDEIRAESKFLGYQSLVQLCDYVEHLQTENARLTEKVVHLQDANARLHKENARLRAALVKIEHYYRDTYETPLDVIYEMKQISRNALNSTKGGANP